MLNGRHGVWYLPRFVTAEEWEKLANTHCVHAQRSDDGEGTYAFCQPLSDSLILTWLNHAAPGEWRRVA
jgi:hypothetical protein